MVNDLTVFRKNQKEHFDCDCGLPSHGLVLETDDNGFLSVYVRNAHCELSIWQRLKAAWDIVSNRHHFFSEVILDREQVESFVDYTCSLMHNENTR